MAAETAASAAPSGPVGRALTSGGGTPPPPGTGASAGDIPAPPAPRDPPDPRRDRPFRATSLGAMTARTTPSFRPDESMGGGSLTTWSSGTLPTTSWEDAVGELRRDFERRHGRGCLPDSLETLPRMEAILAIATALNASFTEVATKSVDLATATETLAAATATLATKSETLAAKYKALVATDETVAANQETRRADAGGKLHEASSTGWSPTEAECTTAYAPRVAERPEEGKSAIATRGAGNATRGVLTATRGAGNATRGVLTATRGTESPTDSIAPAVETWSDVSGTGPGDASIPASVGEFERFAAEAVSVLPSRSGFMAGWEHPTKEFEEFVARVAPDPSAPTRDTKRGADVTTSGDAPTTDVDDGPVAMGSVADVAEVPRPPPADYTTVTARVAPDPAVLGNGERVGTTPSGRVMGVDRLVTPDPDDRAAVVDCVPPDDVPPAVPRVAPDRFRTRCTPPDRSDSAQHYSGRYRDRFWPRVAPACSDVAHRDSGRGRFRPQVTPDGGDASHRYSGRDRFWPRGAPDPNDDAHRFSERGRFSERVAPDRGDAVPRYSRRDPIWPVSRPTRVDQRWHSGRRDQRSGRARSLVAPDRSDTAHRYAGRDPFWAHDAPDPGNTAHRYSGRVPFRPVHVNGASGARNAGRFTPDWLPRQPLVCTAYAPEPPDGDDDSERRSFTDSERDEDYYHDYSSQGGDSSEDFWDDSSSSMSEASSGSYWSDSASSS